MTYHAAFRPTISQSVHIMHF